MKKLVLIVLFGLGAWFFLSQKATEKNVQKPAAAASIVQVEGADAYRLAAEDLSPDQFWAVNKGSIKQFKQRSLDLLRRYQSVHPLGKRIVQQTVGRLGFCEYEPDKTVRWHRTRGGGAFAAIVMEESQYRFELESGRRSSGPFLLAYNRGVGVLYAPAFEIQSDAVLAGFLFHELGHLLLDLEGTAGVRPPRKPVGSAEYFQEEAQMHELQGIILDHAVEGQLTELLDSIIVRSDAGGNGEYSVVHKAVTSADLAEFKRLFQLEQAGEYVTKTMLTQFKLMLDFRYIDRNYSGPPEGAIVQKAHRYRFIMGR